MYICIMGGRGGEGKWEWARSGLWEKKEDLCNNFNNKHLEKYIYHFNNVNLYWVILNLIIKKQLFFNLTKS